MTDIVERLQKATLYEGNGELSALPEEAADAITALRAEVERLRSALIPFACRCARKGEGAGGTCLAPGGVCSSWNARAALEEKP